MLKANRKTSRSLLNRHRPFCATLACVVLSGTFPSCHPTPERDADPLMAGRSPRPIDTDPRRAEIIGRRALATIGYIPIMNLAREAGWVTTIKMESTRRSDPALLAQAAAARGFIEVFSKYAVVAGVTSQADSPLPGPGDAAAIGIIVLGLIDAGLLAGAILNAIADTATTTTTTSSPPIATTMPMATATPTTTAPPIATWAPITKVKTDEEKERCRKVNDECIDDCSHLMGQGYRPPRPGKKGRGHAGGGTNTQFDYNKCLDECLVANGCK